MKLCESKLTRSILPAVSAIRPPSSMNRSCQPPDAGLRRASLAHDLVGADAVGSDVALGRSTARRFAEPAFHPAAAGRTRSADRDARRGGGRASVRVIVRFYLAIA
jgi:hypothetical protein